MSRVAQVAPIVSEYETMFGYLLRKQHDRWGVNHLELS